jgi:hypothetical protein
MEARMDVGMRALQLMHEGLRIDDCWTIRAEREFSWIAHRLQATLRASRPFVSHDILISRVTSSILLIEDVGVSRADVDSALAYMNHASVGAAYVYSPLERTVSVLAAHNVHEETLNWRPVELSAYHMLSLERAERTADELAERLRGEVARRIHPASGERLRPDDLLSTIERDIAPVGELPSRFANAEEITAVHELVRDTLDFSAGGDESGICIEVAFGESETVLIQLTTDEPHPFLGNGLGVFTTLPLPHTLTETAALVAQLNQRQFAEGEVVPAVGAWCVRPARNGFCPAHARFVPNLLFRPGLAAACAMSAINQAIWADQIAFPGLGRRSALPALGKGVGLPAVH